MATGHNSRRKRRHIGPLQAWKVRYNYIVGLIRAQKDAYRTGFKVVDVNNVFPELGGVFRPTRRTMHAHSTLAFLRAQAHALMLQRPAAQAEAQRLWNSDRHDG